MVESLAQREANVKSKQNMQFVAKNYTKDMDEFLKPLIKATKNEAFNNLIDEYVKKGLLNEEESKMFKIYLNTRAGWLQYNLSAMKENCKQF